MLSNNSYLFHNCVTSSTIGHLTTSLSKKSSVNIRNRLSGRIGGQQPHGFQSRIESIKMKSSNADGFSMNMRNDRRTNFGIKNTFQSASQNFGVTDGHFGYINDNMPGNTQNQFNNRMATGSAYRPLKNNIKAQMSFPGNRLNQNSLTSRTYQRGLNNTHM